MRLNLPTLLAATLILTACSGDSAIDGVKEIPNRFGNAVNALDDFSPGSTGDSNNARGLRPNEVRVTMEVPVNVAPDGEPTRRNLRIVIPDKVEVFRTNTAKQRIGSVPYTTASGADGHLVLTFEDGVPIAPDVIIEASYTGATSITMKALAADSDRDIKVNPFSDYLVERVIWDKYQPVDLQTVQSCVDDALCLNKYVWSAIADQVHDFEIDIPDNANASLARELLHGRADFSRYVDDMADYALLEPGSSGRIRASSADYNSVFFALELGQTFRESTVEGAGQWGVRSTREERLPGTEPAYLYPALSLASFDTFNIEVTTLVTDMPYHRETLIHGSDGNGGQLFYARDKSHWDPNSHASAPGAATLTPNYPDDTPEAARLLAGRSLYQSVTGRESNRLNGWTRNPYFFDAYTSAPEDNASSPDRVLGNYFTAGKAIALADDNGKLKRRQTLEDHFLSVFELHLQRSQAFDLSVVAGQTYNVLYLASQFANAGPLVFETGHGTWALESADTDEADGNVEADTFVVTRSPDGTVSSADSSSRSEAWNLANRKSLVTGGPKNIGRLTLFQSDQDVSTNQTESERFDSGQPDLGLGAATPDGSLMAFNLDAAQNLGNGLAIASRQHDKPLADKASFQVQGVIVEMTNDSNRLIQARGTLYLDGTSSNLSLKSLDVVHNITDNEVLEPETGRVEATVQTLVITANADGQISFGSEGSLQLHGFYSPDAEAMFLTLKNSNGTEHQTGLLMATLIPESD